MHVGDFPVVYSGDGLIKTMSWGKKAGGSNFLTSAIPIQINNFIPTHHEQSGLSVSKNI